MDEAVWPTSFGTTKACGHGSWSRSLCSLARDDTILSLLSATFLQEPGLNATARLQVDCKKRFCGYSRSAGLRTHESVWSLWSVPPPTPSAFASPSRIAAVTILSGVEVKV